jgi:methylmalonyl-CoA mutase N-terminal domain/subunit
VRGIEQGWFQRRIAQSAARQQWEIEQRRRLVVGVNEFVTDEPELAIPVLRVGADVDAAQRERLASMRAARDQALVRQRLDDLRSAAATDANLIPYILDCARARATLYEIRHAMEQVFGAYREPVFF